MMMCVGSLTALAGAAQPELQLAVSGMHHISTTQPGQQVQMPIHRCQTGPVPAHPQHREQLLGSPEPILSIQSGFNRGSCRVLRTRPTGRRGTASRLTPRPIPSENDHAETLTARTRHPPSMNPH